MLLQTFWSSLFWMNFISWNHYQAHSPREPCKMHHQNLLWHETTHSPYKPPAPLHSLGDCQGENTYKKAERTQDYKSLSDSLGRWEAPEKEAWQEQKERYKILKHTIRTLLSGHLLKAASGQPFGEERSAQEKRSFAVRGTEGRSDPKESSEACLQGLQFLLERETEKMRASKHTCTHRMDSSLCWLVMDNLTSLAINESGYF